MAEKNDVFVGNVAFNTTEEQLKEIFEFVGQVKNIRILQDKETGRPKGFAFIEYLDANTALAAIRMLNGRELNGRKLKVSFSNNSNLKDMARAIGQDVSESAPETRNDFQAVTNLPLGVAWDILDLLKKMADEGNGDKARALFEAHPPLAVAVSQIQRRLGIVTGTTTFSSMDASAGTAYPAAGASAYSSGPSSLSSTHDSSRFSAAPASYSTYSAAGAMPGPFSGAGAYSGGGGGGGGGAYSGAGGAYTGSTGYSGAGGFETEGPYRDSYQQQQQQPQQQSFGKGGALAGLQHLRQQQQLHQQPGQYSNY